MSAGELRKYALVTCTVVDHQHYGLVVETTDCGQRGFVDEADIADTSLRADAWPQVGDHIRGVVLGYTRTGRIRLSTRHGDVLLVESVPDPAGAIQEWMRFKESGTVDTGARTGFYRSPNAGALLKWALTRPSYSTDFKLAAELLENAPRAIRDLMDS